MTSVTALIAEEERAAARGRVTEQARRGIRPSDVFSERDLEWAFRNRQDELAELDKVFVQARDAKRAAKAERLKSEYLERIADDVRAEWRRNAEREEHELSIVEAQRRLDAGEVEEVT